MNERRIIGLSIMLLFGEMLILNAYKLGTLLGGWQVTAVCVAAAVLLVSMTIWSALNTVRKNRIQK